MGLPVRGGAFVGRISDLRMGEDSPHRSGDPEEKQPDSDDPTGSQKVAGGGVVPDATSGKSQQ